MTNARRIYNVVIVTFQEGREIAAGNAIGIATTQEKLIRSISEASVQVANRSGRQEIPTRDSEEDCSERAIQQSEIKNVQQNRIECK